MKVNAYAADQPGGRLEPYTYDLGDLGPRQVDLEVQSCGICHSDLSMLKNDWGMSSYPLVPGHEVIGTVTAVGSTVTHLKPGQTVGLGWFSGSCSVCPECMSGDHHLCGSNEQTIVGRFGGFADRVRCQAKWAIPLPRGLDPQKAGPLFCGGITVFNPIVSLNIKPTDRVGVVGIGGLGHMAVAFLNAWGCHVTAFSSSPTKREEALNMGADAYVASTDSDALAALAGSLDVIIVTANVTLDWASYIQALRPRGRLHFVGAVLEPLNIGVFSLLTGQKSVSASPLGSPATIATMLEFAAHHGIEPVVEQFPMTQVNEALDRLENGKPRFRVVLTR